MSNLEPGQDQRPDALECGVDPRIGPLGGVNGVVEAGGGVEHRTRRHHRVRDAELPPLGTVRDDQGELVGEGAHVRGDHFPREEFKHGATPQNAVRDGFRHGARVVTAAALIMIAVFSGFIVPDDPIIKSVGFGFAFGIMLDAFLVRMTLIPALMTVMGRHAWWLPSWLDRVLPNVDLEGAALDRAPDNAPAGAPTQVAASVSPLLQSPRSQRARPARTAKRLR